MSQQTVETNAAVTPPAPTLEPDYAAMSDTERLEAAAEIITEEVDEPEVEAAPPKKTRGRVKKDTPAEDASGEPAEAAADKEPEASTDGESKESVPAEEPSDVIELSKVELERYRKLEREKDAAFAQLRRQEAGIKAERAQLARDREENDAGKAEVEQARRLLRMAKENPLTFHEEAAKHAEMKPSELLERVQRRYLNQGQPGPAEQQDELRAMRAEVAMLTKAIKERDTKSLEERQQAELATTRQDDAQRLDAALAHPSADRERWKLISALKDVGGDTYKETLNQAVELVHKTGGEYTIAEVLDYLESQERKVYERGELIGSRLRGAQGSGTPGNLQKPDTGTGSQARARKPAAGQRTVNTQDAANSSGARRELTLEERMEEGDNILRAGIVRS